MLKLRFLHLCLALSSFAILNPSVLAQTSPSKGPSATPSGNNPSGGSTTPISTPFAGGTGGIQSTVPGVTVTTSSTSGTPIITLPPTTAGGVNTAAVLIINIFAGISSTASQQTFAGFVTSPLIVFNTVQPVPNGITLTTVQNSIPTIEVVNSFSILFTPNFANNMTNSLLSAFIPPSRTGTATTTGTTGTATTTGTTGTATTTGTIATTGNFVSIQAGNTKATIRPRGKI